LLFATFILSDKNKKFSLDVEIPNFVANTNIVGKYTLALYRLLYWNYPGDLLAYIEPMQIYFVCALRLFMCVAELLGGTYEIMDGSRERAKKKGKNQPSVTLEHFFGPRKKRPNLPGIHPSLYTYTISLVFSLRRPVVYRNLYTFQKDLITISRE
jgi:hypothetical protein